MASPILDLASSIRNIRTCRQAGKLDEAEALLAQLGGYGDSPGVLLESAKLAYLRGRVREAQALAGRVLEKVSDSVPAARLVDRCAAHIAATDPIVAKADKLRRGRFYAEALEVLDDAGSALSDNPAALALRIRLLSGTGQHEQALELAQGHAAASPHDVARSKTVAELELTRDNLRLKAFRKALGGWDLEEADEAAAILTKPDVRSYALAEIALLRGDLEQAREQASQASYGTLILSRLYDLLKLIAPEKASEYSEKHANLSPGSIPAAEALEICGMLHASGRIDRLEAFTTELLEGLSTVKRASNSATHWHLQALYLQGRYADVLAFCHPMDAFIGNAAVLDIIVRSLFQIRRDEEALALFESGVARVVFKPLKFQVQVRRKGPTAAYALYEISGTPSALAKALPETYATHPKAGLDPAATVWLADHGIGDEIRHAATYDALAAAAKRLTITCDPRALSLMQRSFPQIDFLPVERWRHETRLGRYASRGTIRGGRALAAACDTDLQDRLDRAQCVGVVCASISKAFPRDQDFARHRRSYLKPDPLLRAQFRNRFEASGAKGDLILGISWRSTMASTGRNVHYSQLQEWRALFDLPRLTIVTVQSFLSDDEIALLKAMKANVIDLADTDVFDNLENLAAALAAMDFYVGPATSTSEMAGAVGTHGVFLANTYETGWRARERGRDVWHPRLRVATPTAYGTNATMLESAFSDVRRLQSIPYALRKTYLDLRAGETFGAKP